MSPSPASLPLHLIHSMLHSQTVLLFFYFKGWSWIHAYQLLW